MKILENNEPRKSLTESLSSIPEGTQVVVGSDMTLDMDYYEADGTDRIMWAIEGMIEKLMKSGRYDAETDCICVNITVGDKELIDDEGNILDEE